MTIIPNSSVRCWGHSLKRLLVPIAVVYTKNMFGVPCVRKEFTDFIEENCSGKVHPWKSPDPCSLAAIIEFEEDQDAVMFKLGFDDTHYV